MIQHAATCLKGPKSRVRRTCKKKSRKDSAIRLDLVARVRSEIEAGTYDTTEKMHLALERMFSRFSA